ncbi:EAL domain-containing protein [Acidovorax sp. KKS102]|uniref:bifunctional diguanylate cyclase/phosphodiesterase n=1 Tax=Acidovorax sp. KKS102 TaxID=358220 RepID=UPI0005BA8CDF|nr:EAL domain-containing protein [Acidovorax sp. KKS102]
MVVLLVGTWGVSIATARLYLQQQLLAQGADAAVSLALSMSQYGGEPAMTETLINALFDGGHFQIVRYTDVQGRVVVERDRSAFKGIDDTSPAWFSRWVTLEATPGEALVSKGWQQAGKVTIVADPHFAYQALWEGTLQLGALLALAGLLWGLGITLLMRRLRRPLQDLAQHADAIGNGQFASMTVPQVSELRSVAHALNRMAGRVQTMFAEQSARISQLHAETTRDPVCGLPNREFFMGALRSALHEDGDSPEGGLLLMRVADLATVNRHMGRDRTDQWLTTVAETLAAVLTVEGDSVLARMNGADFAYLLPGANIASMRALAHKARMAVVSLQEWPPEAGMRAGCDVAFGIWRQGEDASRVMARQDTALMLAENAVDGVAEADTPGSNAPQTGETAWGVLLEQSLAQHRFQLIFYPVCRMNGALLHREAMLRMLPAPGETQKEGTLLSAGQFMPAALRLGRMADCDLVAVALALEQLNHAPGPIAVNISPRSLVDTAFLSRLEQALAACHSLCHWLSFELSERGLEEHIDGLTALSQVLARHGCRLGIEHFGRQMAILPRLQALQVHYLKVDGAFVADIHTNTGHQRLIRAMVDVARGLEIEVYAEQVGNHAQWEALEKLGILGVTGPAATQQIIGWETKGGTPPPSWAGGCQ